MRLKNRRAAGVFLAASLSLAGLAAKNSFPAGSPEEFRSWQDRTRPQLEQILFNGHDRGPLAPLDPVFGREETRAGYILTEVTFTDRPGHQTHGWLARPQSPAAPRLPAVIALHGHGGTGIQTFDPDNMYFYGDMLAQAGYIALAIDIGHEAVEIDRNLDSPFLPKKVDFPYTGQKVWMVKRALALLQARPDVDPDAIGIVGLSNGSFTSLFAAAVMPEIKLTVASCSLIMHDRMWHRELVHCRCQYLEGMDGALDYYDLAALIAPRPLLLQYGEKDKIFPIGSAKRAYGFVRQAYDLAGAPDHVGIDVHPGAHAFVGKVPMEWFRKYLPLPSPTRTIGKVQRKKARPR